jgi:hypothetical protein
MKSILTAAVLLFPLSAFAQDAPPVANKPVQLKPIGRVGCKPLGLVETKKLWVGECGELRRMQARRPAPTQTEALAPAPTQTGALAPAPTQTEVRDPVDARAQRRNGARRVIHALPQEEEKTWWGR